MSDPRGQIHRKLAVQIGFVVLALPMLYVASSGPVLRWSERPVRPPDPASHFSKIDAKPEPLNVRSLYKPLIRMAIATHLEAPLCAYLRMWNVFPIMTGHGRIFFLVVHQP